MGGRRRRAWLGEFGVIVIGVLVALGVDDARQFLADRTLEADLLARVRSDLAADANDLVGAYISGRRRLWTYDRLIASDGPSSTIQSRPYPELESLLAASNWSGPTWDSINAPLSGFVVFPEFDLSDDSYVEMTSTGSLQTIADTQLRAQLVAYYRVARDKGGDARWAAGHYERVESALGTQNTAIADLISVQELEDRFRSEPMQAELRHARARTLMLLFFLEEIAVARRDLLDAIENDVP